MLEELGPAAQMLGEDLRRPLADELLQVGVVPAMASEAVRRVEPFAASSRSSRRRTGSSGVASFFFVRPMGLE